MNVDKNPIIYGSFVGVFEHFAGLAPRTIIDYKQYFNSSTEYQKRITKLNISNLYKGTYPYLTGIGFAHAWMFSFLEMSKKKGKNEALYGMIGRCGHDIFMLPGDTIRMYSNINNISTRESIRSIYNKNGFRGFFKGLTPSILMNLPTGAIEFSTIVTCPLDTIKTCRQMQKGNNIIDTYKYILYKRGWKGFFRGALLRSFQCCISYGTYEWLCKNMNLELDD